MIYSICAYSGYKMIFEIIQNVIYGIGENCCWFWNEFETCLDRHHFFWCFHGSHLSCVWSIMLCFGQTLLIMHSIYHNCTEGCSLYINEEKQDANLNSEHKLINLFSFLNLRNPFKVNLRICWSKALKWFMWSTDESIN